MSSSDVEKRLSLRQRNSERIRQRIVTAALDLFTTEGYDQTTMDAIAERAEVGRATLFKYFPTKSTLLLPLSQQVVFAELRPQVQALLERQPTSSEALRYYFALIGKRIRELPDVTRALITIIGTVEDEASEQVPDFAETLNAILRHGQERGEVRRDIPVEQLSVYISVLFGDVMHRVVKSDDLESYAPAMNLLLSFLETGLSRE
ncbi:MAG TPA: TetR/AcrR family transcriptional regulator [Ktedonobacteraceae bacterium]|jgi:AcrR family transcriptional regulator|nr:TetR/AcrR family transcriptional regulator [Ktedonobacteraceae bacterium]